MDIKEIKAKLSITQVLAHYGITHIRNKQIHCPFHDDKVPSMQVHEEKNFVYCHSSNCSCGGKPIDVIDFIMYKENRFKHEAIKKAISLITNETTATPIKSTMTEQINYSELFTELQQSFVKSEKAQQYASSRNINHAKLEIGFNTSSGKVFRGLKNCIIFPLKDINENIVSLYGRNIDNNDKAKHYYTKDRKGLYQNTTNETQIVIITESIVDSATIQVHTAYETLALFGTNGFNDEHITLLKSLPNLKEIIFFLDGDEAGKQAVAKHSEAIKELLPNLIISNVNTPDGEDINSLTISHEPEILNHLISERQILFSSPENTEEENPKQETDETPINTALTSSKLDTKNEDYLAFEHENLLMSIIGGVSLFPLDKLKITLGITRTDSKNKLHRLRQSNLDLYSEEQLQRFIRTASEKLEIGTKQLNLAIAELTEELEEHRNQKIEKQKPPVEKKKVLSSFRKEELLKILKRTDLMQHINTLIGNTGIVGEEVNRLIMWTVFTSRLMENPLHIICLGASGTGKTYLQERVAELFPKEEKISFTASTEQAFYYVGRTELKHKIILIEDMDGASSVLYVLRELQSKSYVSKLVPIKDSKGNMQTKLLEVEGPICLSGTTTKEKLYEDNANRCLLIYLDNSNEQQQGIMQRQRNVSAGLINKAGEESTIELLQDLQTLFRPINIVNPFATKLHIPETVFKPLRTNAHYLQFIEAITFIHQFQREIKKDNQGTEFIETTLEDIELANELLKEILLAKSDELTKACRDFLELVKTHLQTENKKSFFRSDVRAWTRLNPDNVRHYLAQLSKYGYVKIIGGNKYKGGFEYEVTNKEEYNHLKNSINTALDKALAEVKLQQKESQLRVLRTVAN
jgi:DNA primase